jgi:hypothetical protein
VASHLCVVPTRRMCGGLSALPMRFHVILFSCKDIITCKLPTKVRLESKKKKVTATTTWRRRWWWWWWWWWWRWCLRNGSHLRRRRL